MVLVMLKCLHFSHTTITASKSVDSTTEKPHEREILACEPRRKGILAPKSGGDLNDSVMRK